MLDSEQLEALKQLLRLTERYGLAELEVQEGGLKIVIRGLGPPTPAPGEAPAAEAESPEGGAEAHLGAEGHHHSLLSPLTGTFYRSSGPDAPAYVESGQQVEEGQTIGLIEAMKVFSDVPADCAGRVVEICARNGQLVQHGDTLLIIDQNALGW